jgi:hypothetical protein
MASQVRDKQVAWLQWLVVNNSHYQLFLGLSCYLMAFIQRDARLPPPKYSKQVTGCKRYLGAGDLLLASYSTMLPETVFDRLTEIW